MAPPLRTALPSADITAVHALYSDHHRWLLGWLRRRLPGDESAADLTQDTFARILAAGQAQAIREPRAYLATVANHLFSQHLRRQALERAYLQALAALPEPVAPSEEVRALALEALGAVARMLDGLPPRVREIFLLSQFEELTYPQIAERLGTTVNVVQKAMGKAFRHCYAAAYA